MYDELTEVDIKKMEEEITYRTNVLGPMLLKEMSRTREYGDLSENAEYKEAKREKRKNEGRIRYLNAMIRTAKVIEVGDKDGVVNLFDRVRIYNEKAGAEKEIQIVTTLRQNALLGFVSKESPLGRALMGSPKLLVLDEPSLGLAPLLIKDIFNTLIKIKEEGTTILIVEQNALSTLKIADYAYVLELGKVSMHGTADELIKDERLVAAYLGGK